MSSLIVLWAILGAAALVFVRFAARQTLDRFEFPAHTCPACERARPAERNEPCPHCGSAAQHTPQRPPPSVALIAIIWVAPLALAIPAMHPLALLGAAPAILALLLVARSTHSLVADLRPLWRWPVATFLPVCSALALDYGLSLRHEGFEFLFIALALPLLSVGVSGIADAILVAWAIRSSTRTR
ncbi:MAG: hypothetical protein K2Y21_07260 [Phycisphaerales bacterium]|nr:hypothetical protein [Phycisphaerales bacterium]